MFTLTLTALVMGLSSFKSTNQEPVVQTLYKQTCKDGTIHYFTCDCKLDDAKYVGSLICASKGQK
ncbi:hypothetical protein J2X31_000587 [Flavobacterium arsenatis]|uniref:Uncharacterized protein n=1 Tax=Flavobacterium arsenatis TaxID=1484332 RepID=A0ABU1TKT6_9FLAO|nr:hypothetical protein [Flavobacterium arsenatis]